MEKHPPSEEMKKELDIFLSKINALEVVSSDEYQKGVVKVLRDYWIGRLQVFEVHGIGI